MFTGEDIFRSWILVRGSGSQEEYLLRVQLVSSPFLFLIGSLACPEVGSLLCHTFLVPQCFLSFQSKAVEPAVDGKLNRETK